jgi:hypothetical protein
MGRREDEAALRDAWCFHATGDDPGPSGQILRTWRELRASRRQFAKQRGLSIKSTVALFS